MATRRRTDLAATDPASIPDWVLSFGAAAAHWLSLVPPDDQPPGTEVLGRSWHLWTAERTYREVSTAWLAEHAPDLGLYDRWNERRRRAGLPRIHGPANRQPQRASAR